MALKIRHTNRYREILVALVRHGFGFVVEEMGLMHVLTLPRKWIRRGSQDPAKTFGERIRLVLEELGPAFIKLGQLSSTRQDLMSQDIIRELQKLQDQVPPFSIEEVRAIIEQELHAPMEEIYSEFRDEPIAAASIGQVHFARLKTGEAVAVKVQRPAVDKIVELDLDILQDLAALAERRVNWAARYQIGRIVEELSKSMRRELNYTYEGKNAEKVARQFLDHPRVHIPKIYWEFTTAKVLTQEFIEGTLLKQTRELEESGLNLNEIAETLVNAMFHQVLIEGFFHADPHPGNVIVMRDGRIAFVDFGLVGRLNEQMKENLCTLVISLMRQDTNGIIRSFMKLGLVSDEADITALREDLDILQEQYYNIPLSQISLGQALNEMFIVANRHNILVPSDLTLLGKALVTVEGVAENLYPELSLIDMAEPFGRRLIKEHYHPQHIKKRWWRLLTEFTEGVAGFPRQANKLAKLIRTGKLRVEIGIPEIDLLLRKLDHVSNRISISIMILAFSIIMTGLMVASSTGRTPAIAAHFPIMQIGSTVAGLMFIWLLYSIFKSGKS